MVAHDEYAQRVAIEKYLNSLGYYHIAPVGSFKDAVILSQPPCKAFDLLIISPGLCAFAEQGLSFEDKGMPRVSNIFICEDQSVLTQKKGTRESTRSEHVDD
jgi:hypothetical protein